MRSPLPEGLWTTARYPLLGLCLSALATIASLLMPAPSYGNGGGGIEGLVINGTAGEVVPADLEVTLHIIAETGEVDLATASTDSLGHLHFHDVQSGDGFSYAMTTSYRDVLYSSGRLDPSEQPGPLELTVYETTSSIANVHVDADLLLISGSEEDGRSLSASELVRLVNTGDRTFVPALDRAMDMNFLRFSLPEGATDPNVTSDLPSGQIINVGTGFALPVPVTPGSHQVTYTYRIPYEGRRLELIRSFPMGAGSFRLLLEDTLGELVAPGLLTLQSAASTEGKSYRVWGADQIPPATRLNVEIGGLPRQPFLQRIGYALTDAPYLKIGVPGAVSVVATVILLYALLSKGSRKAPAFNPGVEAAAAARSTDAPVRPRNGTTSERRSLEAEIARLDDLFEGGEVPEEEYLRRRQELKVRLLQIALTSELE